MHAATISLLIDGSNRVMCLMCSSIYKSDELAINFKIHTHTHTSICPAFITIQS